MFDLETIRQILIMASVYALFVERMVQIVKGFIPEEQWKRLRTPWKHAIILVVSLLGALLFKESLGQYWYMVAIIATVGSNMIHDILKAINEFADNLNQVKGVKKVIK